MSHACIVTKILFLRKESEMATLKIDTTDQQTGDQGKLKLRAG